MTSQKEEHSLFGESSGDDIFSQIQQTTTTTKHNPGNTEVEKTQPLVDASALFGEVTDTAAADFFSQPPPPEQKTNASASFFDSSLNTSYFHGASSLTDAYHPQPQSTHDTPNYDYNAYNGYNPNEQYQSQPYEVPADTPEGYTAEYDPTQWLTFDPNVHYYYDEQGQIHYYDPNTNQVYDTQYGYDAQTGDYNYQYDPQYAEYYAQQGYDPSQYDQQQHYDYSNVYSVNTPKESTANIVNTADHSQYINDSQYINHNQYDTEYTPDHGVAQMPVQDQSEQIIDTHIENDYGYQNDPYSTKNVSVTTLEKDHPVDKVVEHHEQQADNDIIDTAFQDEALNDDYVSHSENDNYNIHAYNEDIVDSSLDDLLTKVDSMTVDDKYDVNMGKDMSNYHLYSPGNNDLYSPSNHDIYSHMHSEDINTPTDKDMTTPSNIDNKSPSNRDSYTPSNTDIYSPSNNDSYAPSNNDSYTQSNTDMYSPTDNDSYAPSTKDSYAPSNTDIYSPSIKDSYAPSNTDIYSPSNNDSYAPSSIDIYSSSNNDSYAPSNFDIYSPSNNDSHAPPKKDTYSTGNRDISTPVNHGITTPVNHGITTPVNHGITTPISHGISTPISHGISTPVNHDIITPVSTSGINDTYAPTNKDMYSSKDKDVINPSPSSLLNHIPPNNDMFTPSISSKAYVQRSHSIQTPDRHGSSSPFTGYYHTKPIERSATVPPPVTDRSDSPRPNLISCPDPQCEGENKPKAKFCCECGRPLAGISRSTTPSANVYNGTYNAFTMDTMQNGYNKTIVDQVLENKKKTMMDSMQEYIGMSLMDDTLSMGDRQQIASDYIHKRIHEYEQSNEESDKILLWNMVDTMIKHDDMSQSIVALLTPPTDSMESEDTVSHLDRIYEYLLKGNREDACQYAMDNDLWSHAMIISNSTRTDLYQSVCRQFIEKPFDSVAVQSPIAMTKDSHLLQMIYAVFSGNVSEAVSMTKNAISEWKEALSLVLTNPTVHSQQMIASLGDMLKEQGLVYAAYICYLLSPEVSLQEQADQSFNSLLKDKYTDLDTLYLIEIYEFTLKDKKSVGQLQPYKLVHAWWLSALGYTTESQVYSDNIATLIQSTGSDSILDMFTSMGDTLMGLQKSHSVSGLLTKDGFDTLIDSIKTKTSTQDNTNTGDAIYSVSQDSHDYGYQYPQQVTHPPKGMQSPFQHAPSYNAQNTYSSETNGSWWSHDKDTSTNDPTTAYKPPSTSYEPPSNTSYHPPSTSYQPDAYTPSTSYQPDAYTPSDTTTQYQNDDDMLGLGNPNKKAVETVEPKEEKKEEPKEEKKETGSWGLFSLFSKKKEVHDEKKAVKANLGEESTFYFDEKEQRWVNKLNKTQPTVSTPPPPPQSRPVSAPSQSAMSAAPPTTGPPTAGTPSFNTPPTTRKTGGRKPMRSRYVDVLNTQ